MAFFTYSQNNSGGHWYSDEENGIGQYVIIEADNADDADVEAERIGLYFNGVSDDRDCECCGDRWTYSYSSGDTVPMIYGEDVSNGIFKESYTLGLDSYIHYKNGEIKKVKHVEKD